MVQRPAPPPIRVPQRARTDPALAADLGAGTSTAQTTNDVVVFDRVLGRDAPRRLRLQDKRHKYPLADYNLGLRSGCTAGPAGRWTTC